MTATRDTGNNIPEFGHDSPKSLVCYLVVPRRFDTITIVCVVFDCLDALVVGRFWSAAIGHPAGGIQAAGTTEPRP